MATNIFEQSLSEIQTHVQQMINLFSCLFRAKNVLKVCGRKLCDTQENPISLGVSGIGHFANNVVFAKVVEDLHLDTLNRIASKLLISTVFSLLNY